MTLNDLERRYSPYFAFFTEFVRFWDRLHVYHSGWRSVKYYLPCSLFLLAKTAIAEHLVFKRNNWQPVHGWFCVILEIYRTRDPHIELVSATHICVDVDVNYLYPRSRNLQLLHFSVRIFSAPPQILPSVQPADLTNRIIKITDGNRRCDWRWSTFSKLQNCKFLVAVGLQGVCIGDELRPVRFCRRRRRRCCCCCCCAGHCRLSSCRRCCCRLPNMNALWLV